jgi:hypothetical protein
VTETAMKSIGYKLTKGKGRARVFHGIRNLVQTLEGRAPMEPLHGQFGEGLLCLSWPHPSTKPNPGGDFPGEVPMLVCRDTKSQTAESVARLYSLILGRSGVIAEADDSETFGILGSLKHMGESAPRM